MQSIAGNGGGATYALMGDGTVEAWGQNYYGQLGNGSTTNSNVPVRVTGLTGVQSIATNGSTTYALMGDGTVEAWGYNGEGQLGNGTIDGYSNVPVQVMN